MKRSGLNNDRKVIGYDEKERERERENERGVDHYQ